MIVFIVVNEDELTATQLGDGRRIAGARGQVTGIVGCRHAFSEMMLLTRRRS